MNKRILITVWLFLGTLLLINAEAPISAPLETKSEQSRLDLDPNEELVYFKVINEKLSYVIDRVAAFKKVNVVYPQQGQVSLNDIKVTFQLGYKIPVKQAWEIVTTLLKISGFSIIPKKNIVSIVQTTAINQEAVPVYINVGPEFLPNSDQTIRYLYYFENIVLADQNTNAKNNLTQILNDLLPVNQAQNFLLDETYNSMLITSGARNIKDIMQIILHFDQSGFREAIEVVPLVYVNASEVVNIINQLIPGATQQDQYRYPTFLANKQARYTYFSDAVRVTAIDRNNSIAILGPAEGVMRLRDFVTKYLDRQLDAERLTIHVKPLMFLDAAQFAQVLTNLVQAQAQQGGDQSTGSATTIDSILKGVIIAAEQARGAGESETTAPGQVTQLAQSTSDVGVQIDALQNKGAIIGGNNLVIGAKASDWKIVERIVDECDTLQQQVAIEALILNVSMNVLSQLGVQGRGFNLLSNPENVKFQSAQFSNPYLNAAGTPPVIDSARGVDADFLIPTTILPSGSSLTPPANLVQIASGIIQPGATAVSIADQSGVYALMSVFLSASDTIIIDQPYVITSNHKQANIYDSQTRRVTGSINPQVTGGQVVTNIDTIKAAIELGILPRISNNNENINLEISIKINEFDPTDTAFNTILKRTIVTNINMKDRDVVVLGGLSRIDVQKFKTQVPLLGDIPIIGYFFKNRQNAVNQERVIIVFIRPTIIHPRLGGGANDFTIDHAQRAKRNIINTSELFDSMQDPITRFMFRPQEDRLMARDLDAFMDRGAFGNVTGTELDQQLIQPVPTDVNAKIKSIMSDMDNPLTKPLSVQNEIPAEASQTATALEKMEQKGSAEA